MSEPGMLVKPEFWLKAKRELVRGDPVMAKIIRAYPRVSLQRRGEPFFTLARSIVGQQISVKAAQSIWNRVAALAPEMQPAQIIALRARAHDGSRPRACRSARSNTSSISPSISPTARSTRIAGAR